MKKEQIKKQSSLSKLTTHSVIIEKQKLHDLEHRVSMNLGNFLVLLEEGTAPQIDLAKQKARSDLIKLGPEMEKIAEKIGGELPKTVENFLSSIDSILHSASGWIDEAKISSCFRITQKLEKELRS